ncbi:transketolase C-terminal domain-containing protein [Rathayibacter sp. VKM Ac-2804]|uniref:alpha-ketoacid dehydrogenase subunit beta n=1 Tax=Rathayibacter sp. VKM Ac-2804 TaxID=2609257 RepID=UPI001421C172|nr:transketolase C-terminal domain-containing protein [Rathayibacter sp. VKM Ac-2804]
MPEFVQHTYAEAVNAALSDALDRHPEALLFGEDVAVPGGVFGVTKGLKKRFGDRVFDTPISESAILGGAVGAAMVGRRPIVEIMWVDFTLVALDQLVNQAANVRYVTEGRLTAPITVRTQQGNTPGACAQHSQNLEAIFAHVPGLQVCIATTAQDAYDLLRAAVATDDPAIVIENRALYHGEKTTVDLQAPPAELGASATRRGGTDVTVVTWGTIQNRVMRAAETASSEYGIEAEVIDLRWLRPWDTAAVLESVERTGRLVVVHEAHTAGGFGAEVVAYVSENAQLMAAPIRIGTPDARIPSAVHLATALLPSEERILEAVVRSVDSPTWARASA